MRDVGQYIDRGRLRWSTQAACRAWPMAWREEGAVDRMAEQLRTTGLTGTLVEMELTASGLRAHSIGARVEGRSGRPPK